MTCDKEVRLVEKLADGEATPRERARAEAHLDGCEDCRSHYQFVRALEAASERIDWEEPPEAYWQHLPTKVLARIRDDAGGERSGWSRWWTPAVLRFGAAAAMLSIVVAVGLVVVRDAPEQLAPQAAPVPSGELSASDRQVEEESVGDVSDEGAAEPAPDAVADPPHVGVATAAPESEPSPVRQARPAPAPPPEEPETAARGWEAEYPAGLEEQAPSPRAAAPRDARENRARRSVAEVPGEAGRPQEAEADEAFGKEAALASDVVVRREAPMGAPTSAVADPCEQWRAYLARLGDEARDAAEARYRVALCSIEEHEAAPSEETMEAVERDVRAYLDLVSEGERADELRTRVEELRR